MENSINFWNAQSQTQLNKEDLRSANRTCGFNGSLLVTSYASPSQTDLTADSAPNLIQYHNLFIHSPDLALGDQVRGPKNQLTIVRRVVMQAPKDEINVDKHGTAFDTVRVGIGSLSSLRFELRSYDGEIVDLQGHPWSFSITMYPEGE